MNIRTILYIIIVPLTIWSLEGTRFEQLFKKNKYYQIHILYIIVSLALSYLVVNFLMDFFISSQVLK
ncbi:MAG: DUF1146 domain-containing protein [Mollicutes bacterium]|nr:DUF1146 domain-containing protein [Mollicutes bacterium]